MSRLRPAAGVGTPVASRRELALSRKRERLETLLKELTLADGAKAPSRLKELILDLVRALAKTATLQNTSNILEICQKLCIIVLFLYGTALVNRHSGMIAPLLEILRSFSTELIPKAYPSSPTDWPDSVLPSLEDSIAESSTGALKLPDSKRR